MRHRKAVLTGLTSVGALALVGGMISPAQADIAPQAGDIVIVGSDTVQAAGNFLADGTPYGDPGYNSPSPKNRVFNFDATADANTRLAYGTGGANSGGGQCAPGTGAATGTGNDNATHTETGPCLLKPTSVLRAGQSPVQRPNGSGSGINAMLNDNGTHVNVGRSSSALSAAQFTSATTAFGDNGFVSIKIGTDPLGILSSSSTNAVAVSPQQLNKIYACDATADNWNEVGGTVSGTIAPLVPQVGSGTRNTFLAAGFTNGAIGNPTLGGCVKVVEENDPEAIDASGSPANAIEPMSLSRLLLFKGLLSDGSSGSGGTPVPYFLDPTCPAYQAVTGASLPSKNCSASGNALSPNVFFWKSGGATSGGAFGTLTASGYASVPGTVPTTASDTNATYGFDRNLYLYLRNADRTLSTPFQSGTTRNWVRTLFYNPCESGGSCTTISGIPVGPGGLPYVATGAGKTAISAAGIVPAYTTAVATNAP